MKFLLPLLLILGCWRPTAGVDDLLPTYPPAEPPTIIFDTDMGGDIDDLGALYALHVYADRGQCAIAGVMSSWSMEHHVAGIDATNTYFGRGDLPVGRYEDGPFSKEEYTWYLGETFPSDLTYATAPPAERLYRELLAAAPDTSLTIVVTGRLNNIYKLLRSPADTISPLAGKELVRWKVKEFFIMGGSYPSASGKDANFFWSGPGVAKYVIEECPRPMTFNGGRIGDMKTGYGTGQRINELPADHLLRQGYGFFFRRPPDWTGLSPSEEIAPWSIWDIITVQVAVTGPTPYFKVVSTGTNRVDEDGLTNWVDSPDAAHRYLVPTMEPARYAREIIEPLFMEAPRYRRATDNRSGANPRPGQ